MPDDELPARRDDRELQLREFETGLLRLLESRGLPSEGILVPVTQRHVVFRNLEAVVELIAPDQLARSIYISKFIAAAAAGLFDAALNYLWDETVSELRRRVAQYDIAYFFDTAVPSPERRKRLKDESDLTKIDDSELITGSQQIGLLSDLGYRHLDHIRYMRNWASAAHPNQNQISGLQLIAWLETCVREVINLPLAYPAVEIKRLLSSIKATSITTDDARQIATFFDTLTSEQANNLAYGLFGIYTSLDSATAARDNVHSLLPSLWPHVSEEARQQIGVRYARFVANNSVEQKAFARAFLEAASAIAYIPDTLRSAEITAAVENLLVAHRNYNNFYTEPPLARDLQRLVGDMADVPAEVAPRYVRAVVETFLTNGNGVAWNAELIYRKLIEQFDQRQATIALLSFSDPVISSRLQFAIPRQKFGELLTLMEPKLTSPPVKELLKAIREFNSTPDKLAVDSAIKRLRQRAESAV